VGEVERPPERREPVPERRGSEWDRDRRADFATDDAMRLCMEAARERAQREFDVRRVEFHDLHFEDRPGRDGAIQGEFVGRRGDDRFRFHFACAVDMLDGRLRSINVERR
jgi:hypothetical protein